MLNIKKRVLDLSYKYQLPHVGSCLSAVQPLYLIYERRQPEDPVILSAGHAGVALYCVLERFCPPFNADYYVNAFGTHPFRMWAINSYTYEYAHDNIWCTTGSLGMGLTVAVGYALADLKRKVYCVISDGECQEGCVWEAFANAPPNLEIHMIMNGYSAYNRINIDQLMKRVEAFYPGIIVHCDKRIFKGFDGHYLKMTEKDYERAICEIC